jgi:hypothetical protein
MLSDCGAIGNDMEIGLKNLGSFWENEPNLRGVLRLFEVILHGLADFFGGGFDRQFGLMLLNPRGEGETHWAVVTDRGLRLGYRYGRMFNTEQTGGNCDGELHLLLGGRGGRVDTH